MRQERDVEVSFSCQAILFDLDGVLIDSRAVIRRHWGRWAEKHGFDADEVVRLAHGRRPVDTVRRLMPDAEDPDSLAEDIVTGESTDAEGLVRLPGVSELISSLPQGRWTVATSGPRPIAELRLRFAGVPILPSLLTAEDVREGKPDPAPYLEAARRLGFPADRCLVIEDAPAGVRSGVAAGATVIALATTHPADALRDAGAAVVAENLASVRALFNDAAGSLSVHVRTI